MSATELWATHGKRLSGVWQCTSFEVFDAAFPPKNLITKPHGDDPLARLVITRNGWISVHTANALQSLQPLQTGKTLAAASDEEVARIAKGLTMWCGHLQLHEDEKGLYWDAKVQVAVDPARIGQSEARRTDFLGDGGEGERMAFSTIDGFLLPSGTKGHAVLTWMKLEDA